MKGKSRRNKEKMAIVVIIVCFVLSLIITIVTASHSNKQKQETSATSSSETSIVTGEHGEDNTLISATFIKVVSDKVLEVNVNGENKQVALIGIKAPDDKADEAKQFLNDTLSANKEIWLQYDESTLNEDNQELCYVWLSNQVGVENYASIKEHMIQAILIDKGLAEPVSEYPNSRYEVNFNILNGGE